MKIKTNEEYVLQELQKYKRRVKEFETEWNVNNVCYFPTIAPLGKQTNKMFHVYVAQDINYDNLLFNNNKTLTWLENVYQNRDFESLSLLKISDDNVLYSLEEVKIDFVLETQGITFGCLLNIRSNNQENTCLDTFWIDSHRTFLDKEQAKSRMIASVWVELKKMLDQWNNDTK